MGIALATIMYRTRTLAPETVGRVFGPVRVLLFNKYYMDDLYEKIVVRQLFYGGAVRFLDWMDREVIDRFVDFIGWLARNTGRAMAPIQSGQVQAYGIVVSIGIIVIIGVFLLIGR